MTFGNPHPWWEHLSMDSNGLKSCFCISAAQERIISTMIVAPQVFFLPPFSHPRPKFSKQKQPPQLRGKWPQCCVHWCGGFTLAARQAICLTIEELSRFLICWLVQIYAEDFTKLLIINFYYVSHTRRQGSPVKHWKIAMPSFSFTWPAILRNTPRNRWQFPPLDSLDD